MELEIHPAKYFIKSILARMHTATQSDRRARVARLLQDAGMAPATEEYTLDLFEEMSFPSAFQPHNKRHKASANFLREHRIYQSFHPTKQYVEAQKILTTPAIRRKAEGLLLGGAPFVEVAKLLNKNFERLFGYKSVGVFSHFFFNVEEMDLSRWVRYIQSLSDGNQEDPNIEEKMAIVRGGRDVALFRLHLDPDVETRDIIRSILIDLYCTFKETAHLSISKDKVEMMTKLAGSIVGAAKQLTDSDVKIQEMLAQFESFRLERGSFYLSDMNTLTEGRHSESLSANLQGTPEFVEGDFAAEEEGEVH